MSNTLIVPLDGSAASERALPVAGAIAHRTDAAIVLFTGRAPGVPLDPDAYLDAQAAAHGLHAKHIVADAHDVPLSLAQAAADHAEPVIVMSTRGPRGLDDVVVGSVAAETLRLADAPLLLLGPHLEPLPDEGPAFETMLVCLDGSEAAEAILPVAREWAAKLRLAVWVVQVVNPTGADAGSAETGAGARTESGYVHRVAADLPSPTGTPNGYEVLHDHPPTKAILEFAAHLPRPIIAMATHGRTGLKRLVLGSVSMGVVRHATGPVLVVRPSALT